MFCPTIFRDNNRQVKENIILYLSTGYNYKFMDLGVAIRICCPDYFSTYHYNFQTKYLKYLTNHKGKPVDITPKKVEGFLDALCGYILPKHSPYLIYNVCKIPFLHYENK